MLAQNKSLENMPIRHISCKDPTFQTLAWSLNMTTTSFVLKASMVFEIWKAGGTWVSTHTHLASSTCRPSFWPWSE